MSLPVLQVQGLSAGYGSVGVIHDISFDVSKGALLAIVGLNGAGKSTLLKTLSGVTTFRGGSIRMHGVELTGRPASERAGMGLTHVPEGRRTFAGLSVLDNLRLGGYVLRSTVDRMRNLERVFDTFPVLSERRDVLAGSLSGGQQQMLAIGMGIMASPKLLMLDEPSLGLSPLIVHEVYRTIEGLHRSGMTVILVEQMAELPLRIASQALFLDRGRVTASGSAKEIQANLQALFQGR